MRVQRCGSNFPWGEWIMSRITILLADDHNVLRQGIAQVLGSQEDMQVVAQASSGEEAIQLASTHRPTVALLDIKMPDVDGIEVTRAISADFPEVGIIILTMYKKEDYIFEAIKAGASGYLLKEAEMDELLSAVRTVAAGEAVLTPAIAAKVLKEFRRPMASKKQAEETVELAERDVEILQLLAQGLSNQEIGDRLSIAEKTVRNRLWSVYKQLHLKNRTEAAMYALREGLIEGEDD